MLVVQGGPATAVVRSRCRETVVLLTGELPLPLTDQGLAQVLDLAAAVLDQSELALFHECLCELRARDGSSVRPVEIGGARLVLHEG